MNNMKANNSKKIINNFNKLLKNIRFENKTIDKKIENIINRADVINNNK